MLLAGAFQAVFAVSVLGFHSSLTAGIQAPLPGFHQSNLLVPTSINSGIPSACDDYTYIVNSYDCEDIASSDADIQASHDVIHRLILLLKHAYVHAKSYLS